MENSMHQYLKQDKSINPFLCQCFNLLQCLTIFYGICCRMLESIKINRNLGTKWVNPFLTSIAILYFLKLPENLWFSDVFRGQKNGNIGQKLVNPFRTKALVYFNAFQLSAVFATGYKKPCT